MVAKVLEVVSRVLLRYPGWLRCCSAVARVLLSGC